MAGSYSFTETNVGFTEGTYGTTQATFTVTRSGFSTGYSSVSWAVTSDGSAPADGADFSGGTMPSGYVSFAPDETTQTFTIAINADTAVEPDETFRVQLSNPSEGTIDVGSAVATIQNDDTSYAFGAVSGTNNEGNSGLTPFTFTVTRSGYVDRASTVSWNTGVSGGVRATAWDFAGTVMPSGVLAFAAGETSKTITVNVTGDRDQEGDEGFFVRLTGASDGTVSSAVAPAVIVNDDASLWISPNTSFAPEGDSGSTPFVFNIQRYGATAGTASVDWQVHGEWSSADVEDFAGGVLPGGTVTFADGETLKTITIDVAGDTTPEANESFVVALSNATGATIIGNSATSEIEDDDSPPGRYSLGPTSVAMEEGDNPYYDYTPFTFSVSRSTSTGTSSVDWAVTTGYGPGEADDWDFGGYLPSGSVTFNHGETIQTFTVYVAGDEDPEASERFGVTISNASDGGAIDQPSASGLILDDDAVPGRYSISPTSVTVLEGDTGSTPVVFTVTRTGFSSGVSTVDWAVAGDGAAPADGADFAGGVLPGGTVSFAPGQTTRTITLSVAGDSAVEASEGFQVTLSNPSEGTLDTSQATGIIVNDDASFAIAALDTDRNEGNAGSTPFTFTISRNALSAGTSSVDWAVTSDSAANGADFTGGVRPGGTVTFGPGETSRTITIAVAGDTAAEADEGFTVQLSNATGTITVGSATGTIRNDDTSLSVAAANADRAEGDFWWRPLTFTVTRSGDLSGTSSASWSVAGSGGSPANAADFRFGVLPGGTVSFAAGEASKTITVYVDGDHKKEPDEGFTLTLSDASGATIATATAAGTIRNDDGSANPRQTVSSPNFASYDMAMTAFGLENPAVDGAGFMFNTGDGTLGLEGSGSGSLAAATTDSPTPWQRTDSGYAILSGG